jgi:hypothetical protein
MEDWTPAYSSGRIFNVRLIFVGRDYFHFGFQYRHKVTGEADADKNRPMMILPDFLF